MDNPLEFYARPGIITDLGPYAPQVDSLPRDIGALCEIVQGLMVHIFWAERMGLALSEERKQEVQLRWAPKMMGRLLALDDGQLTEPRPLERRLVSNCRDFSVLLTAILRHQGVPARARCGFGAYFWPGHYEDHWVAEFWDAGQGRWRLVDAQLDAFQRDALGIPFDPLDVPRDQFIVGGQAWKMCRSGQADPDTFGIFDMHGLWFVWGNLLRDLAALNKMELLPWDCWGLMEADDPGSDENLAVFDRVAALTLGIDDDFGAVRSLYDSDPDLRVPPEIISYGDGKPQIVNLLEGEEFPA